MTALLSSDPWAIAGRVALLLGIVFGGVGLFVWRALLRKVAVVAMDECEDTWQKKVDAHLKDREATVRSDLTMMHAHATEAVRRLSGHDDRLEEHSDRMIAFDESIRRRDESLMKSFTDAMERQTSSMKLIADNQVESHREIRSTIEQLRIEHGVTMERIRGEHGAIAREVAEISGVIRAWDGAERRERVRG